MESSNKKPYPRSGDAVPKRRVNFTLIALVAALALLLLLIFLFTRDAGNQDRLGDAETATAAADDPEARCGSQATYDLIKRELFRRAARVRGSDQAAFDQLAAHASVRMDSPLLTGRDEELGTITCDGTLSLDLPPGVAVVGGRRTLSADIGYTLQGAADGSGDVVTITGADAIVTPLATLARTAAPAAEDPGEVNMTADPLAPLEPGGTIVDEPAAPADDAPDQPATASPSFDCRNARSRSEIAVCNNDGLAALDRQMAAQFGGAVSRAGPQERALLERTRGRFLAFRDRCGTNACIADAYRGRMREISDIMAGRWNP